MYKVTKWYKEKFKGKKTFRNVLLKGSLINLLEMKKKLINNQ